MCHRRRPGSIEFRPALPAMQLSTRPATAPATRRVVAAGARTFLSVLLLLIVGIALSRDATWPPLLNEASAENVIQAYLGRQSESARAIWCDCAAPTTECEQVCNTPREDLMWECGTPGLQADAEIREAMASGASSWRAARLIQRHPDYPFDETVYVLLDYSLEQSALRKLAIE